MFGQRLFNRHIDDDEEILLVVHQHWLVGMKELFGRLLVF